MVREATDAAPPPPADASPAAADAPDKKDGKKKRVHDPNAPKRPLTAFFLYMKFARPIIHKEMGEETRPKQVADEGAARWAVMSDADKQVGLSPPPAFPLLPLR